MLQSVLEIVQENNLNEIMKTKVIILTVLTFLLANDLSFAEKEQKNMRQEFSAGDDRCVTRFKFSLKILLQTLQLINAEKPTYSSIQLLNTVCSQMEYLITEGVMTENINSPSIPYKDESVLNNWENVKKQWEKIKNNDYYKSSDLKKLFERYDCNMNAIFKEWKKQFLSKNTIYITEIFHAKVLFL